MKLHSSRPYRSQHLFLIGLGVPVWISDFGVIVAVLCGSALLLHAIPAVVWSWCDRALAGDRPDKPVDRCRWVSFSTGDALRDPAGQNCPEEPEDVPDWIAPPFRLP